MDDHSSVSKPFGDIRPDEREKLNQCRRNAIASGFITSGIAYLLTRYLITNTPLQGTFLARHSGVAYSFVIGYALYQGVISSGKRCIRSLATLEDSRYGDFARRAIMMHEDKKKLSRAEFRQKYPPDEQRKLFDPSELLNFNSSESNEPASVQTPESQPNDMFNKQTQPEHSNRPKSYQDFQKENRTRNTYPNLPNRQENLNKPAKQPDTHYKLPPGPEDNSKVKRNEYGDVVYEEK